MISPSEFLINSIGLPKSGTHTATENGRCVACGQEYHAGELIAAWEPSDSFFDFSDLAYPASSTLCGACHALWQTGKDFIQTHTKSIVTKEGVFPFFSNDAVAYWLLNPPEPPFLAFIGTQKTGHIVWKATVSTSKEIIFVRYNDKLLRIRRPLLLKAVEAARLLMPRLLEEAKENALAKGRKFTLKPTPNNLLIDIDRTLERLTHGSFREGVLTVAEELPEYRQAYECLRALGTGELWGLVHILYASEPLEKPEPKIVPA